MHQLHSSSTPPFCSRCNKPAQRLRHKTQVSASINSHRTVWPAIQLLHDQAGSLAHMFTGATAAYIQGADITASQLQPLQIKIQWDFMDALHLQLSEQLQQQLPPIQRLPGGRTFTVSAQGQPIEISCELNAVLQMDPNRVLVSHAGKQLWCESLLAVRSSRQATPDLVAAVNQRLQQLQAELTEANGKVWSQGETTDAWANKVGSPEEAAAWIKLDPLLRLGAPLYKHLPAQLTGMKLINLMGSHCEPGTKAVAAALLGAQATCVDISPANVQYGQQLAAAAGADVRFLVSDVLQLPESEHEGYDIVLLGVLHYFVDLLPLMLKVAQLLKPSGLFLLREFHPVSTKLISTKGKKHKVTGDYFSQALVQNEVAYSKYAAGALHGAAADGAAAGARGSTTVRLRQWGLGEVVSSVAAAGLVVKVLHEEPGVRVADAGLPKVFTLVATKL